MLTRLYVTHITQEFRSLDPNFVKLFKLGQLIIEYLMVRCMVVTATGVLNNYSSIHNNIYKSKCHYWNNKYNKFQRYNVYITLIICALDILIFSGVTIVS